MADPLSIPFTDLVNARHDDTRLFILTARECRVVARALDLTSVAAEATGNDPELLHELRDRFAPEGLD